MESDDDLPIVRQKVRMSNGHKTESPSSPKVNGIRPGISVVNKPADAMDVEKTTVTNGVNGKRKSRESLAKPSYKEESGSDSDKPLSKKQKTTALKKPKQEPDSDSDVPLVNKKQLEAKKATIEKRAEKQSKEINAKEKKLASEKKAITSKVKKENGTPAPKMKTTTPSKRPKQEDSDDDDKPLAKKRNQTSSQKKGKSTKQVKQEEEADDEDADADADEEEYKFWENPLKGDGGKQWTTLEHNGVVFPPEYQPLPKNVRLMYEGKPVTLHPDAEEVATFYGTMLNSQNLENPTFNKNFFEDFQAILKKTGHAKDRAGEKVVIKELAKCDFKPIFNHLEAEREAKRALPAAEKKRIKAEKDKVEEPFMYCLWDGRKEKVGNFRVEPPGLFRGRGEHPKTGRVKKRVPPEQITINIGKEAQVPAPPEGHKWREVKHDNTGTWLATWQENINNAYKYVMLGAASAVKGKSDFAKFEKARELKKHIAKIRSDYTKYLKVGDNDPMIDRQRATAIYLIDKFALRAGNEKGDDEADTAGCCSLKFEHVTLKPPSTVVFDFLGKDSIRFYNEFEVEHQVFKNLKIFKRGKNIGDQVFDRLTTTALNTYLGNYMTGLSAKVFRTFNASFTMSNLLQDMKSEGTIPEKVKDYNNANREVAILCNHKRTVTASHDGQMEKMSEKINGLRWQVYRIKQMMLVLEPKLKKKKGADFFERPEDLSDEWLGAHNEAVVTEQRDKITKKFNKDNEKRVAEGEKEMKAKELEERLEVATDLEKKLKKERKSKKIEPEGKGPTVEKYEKDVEKLESRIANMRLQAEDKEDNKEVALGTSKINYIDPRLTVVFSKKFNVPIERFFSKTLRDKFAWAIKSVDEDWEF
ncbi:MAG: DNA topoisomerase 1 [Chrysothrix sp. TS-e1954]|nr:MAG: DNA topoisomerase 1 [Chrysothrix sp. TS-e1954]